MILEELVSESFRIYTHFSNEGAVLRGPIPILYFGDYYKFIKSTTRIVTVGLNPSHLEFPGNQLTRFPKAKNIPPNPPIELGPYLDALNSYFAVDPYTAWFSHYEGVLKGLNSSYFGNAANTALHTNFYTPLATNPTWSKLSSSAKKELSANGIGLWHRLVEFLEPDVILASIGKSHFNQFRFQKTAEQQNAIPAASKNASPISISWVQVAPTKEAILVAGGGVRKPFSGLSDKNGISEIIRKFEATPLSR